MIAAAQNLMPVLDAVDHLLLGVSDLDRGIQWVEQRTGVRAAAGGVHPGAGTRNALLSLGPGRYLEIIAPDPDQSTFNFQIDIRGLSEPRLITFAAGTKDLDGITARARHAGFEVFGPRAGSRKTPSGAVLQWRSAGVLNKLGSGGIEPVPFFIQWAPDSPHPSRSTPAGCELESLVFEHPDPPGLTAALKALGIEARVTQAGLARIVAGLRTPKGRIVLS